MVSRTEAHLSFKRIYLPLYSLRLIYVDILNLQNTLHILAADQSRVMQEQMTMQAGGMPQDPKQAYKAEWEALEITEHNWALKNTEQEMISALGPTQDNLYHQSIVAH